MKGYDEGIGSHEAETEQGMVYKETLVAAWTRGQRCMYINAKNKKQKAKAKAEQLLSCIPGPIMLLLP